jgi:hypothetical protein
MDLRSSTSKWLGEDEINELIKLGINLDTDTIEKIGREVLSEGIHAIKSEMEYEASVGLFPSARDVREPHGLEEVSSGTLEEEDYGSDFEEDDETFVPPKPTIPSNIIAKSEQQDE